MVALDVDGTLLDPATQRISPPVRAAVRRVVDGGERVVIATGRSMLGTLPVLDELGLSSGVALCSNGAVKVDAATADTLSIETFDPAPVYAELANRLPGALFAAEQVGSGNLVTEHFAEDELHGPQQVSTVDELVDRPIPRMIANWAGHDHTELMRAMSGVELPLCTVTIDHYDPWVTIVPADVTKGAALEKLRVELGIAREETFAVGDGDNDIQMLEWAAVGVAMGQAPDSVLAVADHVVAPVFEDGLVDALNRLTR
ncbi:HAD family hydrolase [Parasphingorhabdus pacifica]